MVRIGIDIGGTGIQVGVVDEQGNIEKMKSIKTRQDLPFNEQVHQMAECVLDTLADSAYTLNDVFSVGVGIPGIADQKTGDIIKCTNLGWHYLPFRKEFMRWIDKPVYIDNDANVAALAESVAGVSANTSSSVFITIGTGIGSGIILNGKIWNGFHGIGGEFGHTVIVLDGEPCTCGSRGCLERYCSATAIIRMAREEVAIHPESKMLEMVDGNPEKIHAKIVFDAAHAGDTTAQSLMERYISYLSQAIANIVNFLDPEVIVLGGGVSNAGDFLLNGVRENFPKFVNFRDQPLPDVRIAKLGAEAGIIGAAMLG